MNGIPWILVSILVVLVLLGIVMIVAARRRKGPRSVDYRNYFVMGVIWLALGPIMILLPWLLHGEEPSFAFSFFLVMGLAYAIVGLRNRDKWGKHVEVSPRANKSMVLIGVIVGLLFLAIVVFTLFGY